MIENINKLFHDCCLYIVSRCTNDFRNLYEISMRNFNKVSDGNNRICRVNMSLW